MSTEQPTKPLRAKEWTPDHIHLARVAQDVRIRLRALLPRVPLDAQSELAQCCNCLTWALKARVRGGQQSDVSDTSRPHPSNDLSTGTPVEGRRIAHRRQSQTPRTVGRLTDGSQQG
jgi:hypothetical protein